VSSEYIAGSCNIGKGEIRRRQTVALIGLFLVFFSASILQLALFRQGKSFA